MTFGSMTELYLADMENRLKATTMQNKRYLIEHRLLPFFRDLSLADITPAHIRKWQASLLADGVAPTYAKTINNQLSAIFNYAVKYYGLQNNPARIAGSVGKKNADEMKFWTVEQFSAVVQNVPKLPQLPHIRQSSEKQQVGYFLKAESGLAKSLYQLDTVISPIPQFSLTGRLYPVYHLERVYSGDIGQPGNHTVSVFVAQPPLNFVLVEHLRFQAVGLSA